MTEVSTHCKITLEKGLDKETCYDFRKVRSWVMCKAWEKMSKEPMRFSDAVKVAWADAKSECARKSASI